MTDTFLTRQDLIQMDKERKAKLSELGQKVLRDCPNAYINEYGQVIDPCHVYFSEPNDPAKWEVEPEVAHANFREMIQKYVIAKERPRQKQPERIDDEA